MLRWNIETLGKIDKIQIRRAHFVGTSVVVTIDPMHVQRLAIDYMTFFIQRPIENGIVLEMHKLDTSSQTRNIDHKYVVETSRGSRPQPGSNNSNTSSLEDDAIQ